MDGFVHLHVHSHYSLLDGGNRISDLVGLAKEHGSGAVALTDHGNLFGAIDFYKTATAEGIKPILGIEAYISPTDRFDKSMSQREASYHLLLLAMNKTGWQNLLKLSSKAYLEGFYYRPRIDRELLAQHADGLICCSACIGGEIPQALLNNQPDRARQISAEYRDIFSPERFFIELQNHSTPDQHRANPMLVDLASEMGLPLVGTNDVHFLRAEDKKMHEILTCISTGKTLADGGAMEYPPELYLRSPHEMADAFKDLPAEAITNTLKIAEMCDVQLDFGNEYLPVAQVPEGSSDAAHLRDLARAGLAERIAQRGLDEVPDEYAQRLDRELQVLADKGYSSYFLIVNDFVDWARENNIPCNPRGSGVGTLLGYALRISSVDPIQYGLLFERFTDPARQEAPDLDIDICQEGRGRLLQYVREKYGHVAQIITYGTLKARAAIRDVGRVLDVPLPDVDKICKLVPEGPKVKLAEALASEPDLQKMADADPRVAKVLQFAGKLEGLARHAGVHAAGVIVCDRPLDDFLPLYKQADSEDAITQWDGPTCEKAGAMKMDFLGLRTLSILQRTRELVAADTGTDLDPEKLPLDDADVYQLFCEGHTDGIFQFESDGMKNVLMQMRPDRIEVLIAANAMYRPGPMDLISSYVARKDGNEPVPSIHPLVDDILEETYGIMAYQEQVMQVLNRLGKLPLNRALTLIKAISKKKEKTIAAEKPNFITGAVENGIDRAEAEELFALILKFAGYGFNKSHSTMYALLAYWMAYFKTHYPQQFLAATLTFECSDTDKVVQYMAEADRMGVEVSAPDINTCGRQFTVDGRKVRFGLEAVKGVGGKAVEAVLAARQEVQRFENLYHFCQWVDLRAVNRSTIEALIKCGAFDALGASRAAMVAALDRAIQLGQDAAADRKSGQMSFFGDGGGLAQAADAAPTFPDVEPWSEAELLAAEKDTLGFYVTSHPLVKYGRELEGLSRPGGVNLSRLDNYGDGTPVRIGCMIAQLRPMVTKNGRSAGKKMAMLTLEDLTGKADAVAFSETYAQHAELLVPEAIVFIEGTIDRRRERPSIIINEVLPIAPAITRYTSLVKIRLDGAVSKEMLAELGEVLASHHGPVPAHLLMSPSNRPDVHIEIQLPSERAVQPSRELVDALAEVLGDGRFIQLCPRELAPPSRRGPRGKLMRRGNGQADAPASEAVTRFN